MSASKIEILNSRIQIERLFLEAMRIGLDCPEGDPDAPVTAREIIARFDATAEWWFELRPIKLLIEQEGLASGEPELTRQAESMVTAFHDAGLADIRRPRPMLLEHGREIIVENFLNQPKRA